MADDAGEGAGQAETPEQAAVPEEQPHKTPQQLLDAIDQALANGDATPIRQAYDAALLFFPTSSSLWYAYAQYEYRLHNWPELEAIFGRCLLQTCSVRFWQLYLRHIRLKAHLLEQQGGKTVEDGSTEEVAVDVVQQAKDMVVKAFELAINQVGMDYEAFPIWSDYLAFLRSLPAAGLYEQQQQMESIRKVFQRAVQVPMDGLESLWHDYDGWESSLNRLTAKKFLADRSPSYMQARAAARELPELLDPIDRACLAMPPSEMARGGERLAAWERWFAWEQANPLRAADAVVHNRTVYAFKQGIAAMRHFPKVWHDYAAYLLDSGRTDEALAVAEQGRAIHPDSLLVFLAAIDVLEQRDDRWTRGRELFEAMLDRFEAAEAGSDTDLNLLYLEFMDFARRSDSIAAARQAFTRARKSARCSHHVFVAAARMEHHCSKESAIATRIFELGMSRFGERAEYVIEHLRLLIELNDDQSMPCGGMTCVDTRALFERAVQSVPPGEALPIWTIYLGHEARFGDRATLRELERRMRAVYPGSPETSLAAFFLNRHSFAGLHPHGTPAHAAAYGADRRSLFGVSEQVMDLIYQLPLAGKYDGPPIDIADLLSHLTDRSSKDGKSRGSSKRREASYAKAIFDGPSKRTRRHH